MINTDYDFKKSLFTRAMLTGLFVGIIATLFCLFYDVIFRESTRFDLGPLINVSTLIFAVNLIFFVIGILYYGFLKAFKKGDLVFIIVFVLLTLFLVWKAAGVHRSDDQTLNAQFRQLLGGVIIIMGLGASFLIPFLFHNKKFEEYVL
ncbi:MAG: hypothetical protein ACXVB3_11275 [Flavisolibacter sp.]